MEPDAAEFTKKALGVTPQNAEELKRSIAQYEDLDNVQKGELIRLVQDRLQHNGFDKMAPKQKAARTKEFLSFMDRRNTEARAGALIIAPFSDRTRGISNSKLMKRIINSFGEILRGGGEGAKAFEEMKKRR